MLFFLLACAAGTGGGADTGDTAVDDTRDDTADSADSIDTAAPVDTSAFAEAPAAGSCDALLAPYPLDAAGVATVLARLVAPREVWRTAWRAMDEATEGTWACPQNVASGAHYSYAYADPPCRLGDVVFGGSLDASGGDDASFLHSLHAWHALGPGWWMEGDGYDATDGYIVATAMWWRWSPPAGWEGAALPPGEYAAAWVWDEREPYGTRAIDGYLSVYDDGAGGPAGDVCLSVALAGLDTCPEEGDGVVTLVGNVEAVVTFDGAAACDGCGRLTLDGVDAGPLCL